MRASVAALISLVLMARAVLAQVTPVAPSPTALRDTVATRLYIRVAGVFDAESGDPIAGAELVDVATHRSVLTSANGIAGLAFADTGTSLIEVRKVGFLAVALDVAHSRGDTVPMTIVLNRVSTAQTLPTVVVKDSAPRYVNPNMRAFEERRRTGIGHFITEAQLRANDNRRLADVLQAKISGIVILRRTALTYLAAHKGISVTDRSEGARALSKDPVVASSLCTPDVFLDGNRLNQRDTPTNLDEITVADLAAVEFYSAATVPQKFNVTGSGCGALLLWTREH